MTKDEFRVLTAIEIGMRNHEVQYSTFSVPSFFLLTYLLCSFDLVGANGVDRENLALKTRLC